MRGSGNGTSAPRWSCVASSGRYQRRRGNEKVKKYFNSFISNSRFENSDIIFERPRVAILQFFWLKTHRRWNYTAGMLARALGSFWDPISSGEKCTPRYTCPCPTTVLQPPDNFGRTRSWNPWLVTTMVWRDHLTTIHTHTSQWVTTSGEGDVWSNGLEQANYISNIKALFLVRRYANYRGCVKSSWWKIWQNNEKAK